MAKCESFVSLMVTKYAFITLLAFIIPNKCLLFAENLFGLTPGLSSTPLHSY